MLPGARGFSMQHICNMPRPGPPDGSSKWSAVMPNVKSCPMGGDADEDEGARQDEAIKAWRRDLCEQHLEHCERAWRAGVLMAISEAVATCRMYCEPPPEWLAEAVAGLVHRRQTAAEKRRHWENYIHYARWDAVKELRERADELRDWFRESKLRERERQKSDHVSARHYHPHRQNPAHRSQQPSVRDPLGDPIAQLLSADRLSWDTTYEAVALVLTGTPAAGGVEAIRRSYAIVERDMNHDRAAKYFLAGRPG
jgi:hypothetical protein